MSNRLRILPLRWHLVRLAAGTLVPVIAFAMVVFVQLARSERDVVERRLVHSARALALSFERETSAIFGTLEALAQSRHLDGADLAAFHGTMRRVVATQPGWRAIILTDAKGRPLLNSAFEWGAPLPPVAEPESLERVVTEGKPRVGSVARGRRTDAQTVFAFPVRMPVFRDGVLRYVLTAVVSVESLADLVARQAPAEEEWTRTLVDSQGVIAARARTPERFVGQPATPRFIEQTRLAHEGFFPNQSMESESVYVAYGRSPATGWTAAVVVPRAVMDGPTRRSLLLFGALGLLLLLASALGAFVFSRRLERAIADAAEAAEALAGGRATTIETSTIRELADLRDALERSASLLRDRERERDANVAAAEDARREAVAASQAKDAFLAMLGHELRNPLSPIVTSLELLRMRGLAGTPEHEIIRRQLRHVVRLVDDLLDISRITRGTMSLHLEPLELSAVVSRAVEAVSPLLEDRRHALAVDVPERGLVVQADADRLTQILSNLLTNAAKYTPPGGHVRVAARLEGEDVVLSVDDDGEGLTPELAARIFEPFVQGPRTIDRSAGGLGIGLALVRSLVEAHGGRVDVRSDGPGRGSTFTLHLPRAEVEVAADPVPVPVPAPASAASAGRLRILLVDDNADAAEALADLLDMSGFEVAVAHDGTQALERVETFVPDLAIVDIGLPVLDGYGVAQALRERLGARSPVFAALTGYGQENDRERSQAAGFAAHFVKPIDADEIIAFVESVDPRRGAA